MSKNVVVVTGKNAEGEDVTVVVKRPTIAQTTEAQMVESRVFNQGVKKGELITRRGLKEYMIKNGDWDDQKEAKVRELANQIYAGERQLARGGRDAEGNPFTKQQARDLAIQIREWRIEQLILLAQTREYDSKTLEGASENAKFDYFMSVCILNEDETPHFESVEDYLKKADDDNPYIGEAASKLANMIHNYDPDFEKNRPENKFLVKYGFAREEDGSLIEDGHLVDVKGNRVNEDGRLINENGQFIDINGDLVDEEGNPLEDFVEFDDVVAEVQPEALAETEEEQVVEPE